MDYLSAVTLTVTAAARFNPLSFRNAPYEACSVEKPGRFIGKLLDVGRDFDAHVDIARLRADFGAFGGWLLLPAGAEFLKEKP